MAGGRVGVPAGRSDGGSFGEHGFPAPRPVAPGDRPAGRVGGPAGAVVRGLRQPRHAAARHVRAQLAAAALAVGGRKSSTLDATETTASPAHGHRQRAAARLDALGQQHGRRSGLRYVTPDPARFLFEQNASWPSTSGHAPARRARSATGSRRATSTPRSSGGGPTSRRTCGRARHVQPGRRGRRRRCPTTSSAGSPPSSSRPRPKQRLVLILSHHNSLTLENRATRPGLDQPLHGADEFIDLLLRYRSSSPGSTATPTSTRSSPTPTAGGFWEITTASCIDFPQQQQVVELVDNRDGTLSILHDGARPRVPGHAGLQRQLPRPGGAEPRAGRPTTGPSRR